MANLGTFNINTGEEYQKLSELTGITFESGTTYIIQVQNACRILESTTVPTEGGFVILSPAPFSYTPSGGDLYIKSLNTQNVVNIAI